MSLYKWEAFYVNCIETIVKEEGVLYNISIKNGLVELPELIDMHKINKPKVYKFDQIDIAGASIFGFCCTQ